MTEENALELLQSVAHIDNNIITPKAGYVSILSTDDDLMKIIHPRFRGGKATYDRNGIIYKEHNKSPHQILWKNMKKIEPGEYGR